MKDKQLRENGKVSVTFALSLNAQEPTALSAISDPLPFEM